MASAPPRPCSRASCRGLESRKTRTHPGRPACTRTESRSVDSPVTLKGTACNPFLVRWGCSPKGRHRLRRCRTCSLGRARDNARSRRVRSAWPRRAPGSARLSIDRRNPAWHTRRPWRMRRRRSGAEGNPGGPRRTRRAGVRRSPYSTRTFASTLRTDTRGQVRTPVCSREENETRCSTGRWWSKRRGSARGPRAEAIEGSDSLFAFFFPRVRGLPLGDALAPIRNHLQMLRQNAAVLVVLVDACAQRALLLAEPLETRTHDGFVRMNV
jgi:hypothetical protein